MNDLAFNETPVSEVWNRIVTRCHEAGRQGDFPEVRRLVTLSETFEMVVREMLDLPVTSPSL